MRKSSASSTQSVPSSEGRILSIEDTSKLIAELVHGNKHACFYGVTASKLIEVLGVQEPWANEYPYDLIKELRQHILQLMNTAVAVEKLAQKAKRRAKRARAK